MKTSSLILTLSATTVLLALANWYIRALVPIHLPAPLETGDHGPTPSSGSRQSVLDQPHPRLAEEAGSRFPALGWASLETTNYVQYAARLRAVGFPEELVRAMVIADLDRLYEAREAPLKSQLVPHDAPLGARQSVPTAEDWERLRQLRDLQLEKQTALKSILGINVPREVLRTPTSRNYEAYGYALDQLPLDKRETVQTALENFWFKDDMAKSLERPSYVEAYKVMREEWNATVKQVLTPEEFERFEINSTPAGTELARRTVGMEPTDAEFLAMYRLAYKCWVDSGGVYGLWRATPVPPEQIAAAEQEMQAGFKAALGPERYLDYQMATSDTGQQLRSFASRYDLSRDTLSQAFAFQNEADQLLKGNPRSRVSAPSPDGAAMSQGEARLAELQQQLQQLLGPNLWEAWNVGRMQRVVLDP